MGYTHKEVKKWREWREHPARFVKELFGAEPDKWQEEVLEAFPKTPMMALLACKGPGKTCVLAWLCWNYLLTRPDPNIIATSISGDNLKAGLLKEMAKWYAKSPILQAFFVITTTQIFAKHNPLLWWMQFRTWPKKGDTQSQADTLAGFHQEYILFVIDESGSVPPAVGVSGEAALSACTEGHIIQAGNPTDMNGMLYQAYRDRTETGGRWKVIEITGDPDDPKRAPHVNIEWARSQIRTYGRDNPWVMVNVLGKFPPGSINALLSEEDVDKAMLRYYRPHQIGDVGKVLGVDVARGGLDASVICPRQGLQMFPLRRFRNLDGVQGASVTNRIWTEFGADAVFVDATGGFGYTWIDQLNVMNRQAIPVAFNERASEEHKYYNRRSEMYFRLAHWITKEGGALPPIESEGSRELKEALIATSYFFGKNDDRLRLEDKEQIKDRLGFSPDEGDAAALTFADKVIPAARVARAGSYSAVGRDGAYSPFADLERMSNQGHSSAVGQYDPFRFG